MSGIMLLMAGDRPREALISGTSWTVPAGVTQVKVYCLGPGGDGAVTQGGGGGGGAIAIVNALAVTPGASVTYQIGAHGTSDTWFSSSGTALAKTGVNASAQTGGAGGASASCVGDTKYSGGNGGTGTLTYSGGGGGGAAGVTGAGKNGGDDGTSSTAPGGGGSGGPSATDGSRPTGGLGPAGTTSGGGGDGEVFGTPATVGGTWPQWVVAGVTYGPGGGGGAGGYLGSAGNGKNGATYGGGGGGASTGTAGTGGQGLIILEY